jgi:hypothetical protein
MMIIMKLSRLLAGKDWADILKGPGYKFDTASDALKRDMKRQMGVLYTSSGKNYTNRYYPITRRSELRLV